MDPIDDGISDAPAHDADTEGEVSQKGKITTKGATEEEETLLVTAAYGDATGLEQCLKDNPNINLSVADSLGRTAIQLAVANEQVQTLEMLLNVCSLGDIYKALTDAIKREHEHLSQAIIRHEKYAQIEAALIAPGGIENLNISEDLTGLHVPAIILAAQRNQFEVVKALLLKGQSITKPHPIYCPCEQCMENEKKLDGYRLARLRLETYKALSSDCYLAMYFKDPFYTALTLGRELERLGKHEKHFKEDYDQLSDNVSNFLTELLDHVDNNTELDILLNEPVPNRMDKGYARLKLALDYEEKKFVAHPSCQQLVANEFFGPVEKLLPSGRYKQQICMLLITMLFILFYPLLAIIYLFAPNTRFASMMRIPYFRFVGFTISMVAFLTFLIIMTASAKAVVKPDDDDPDYQAIQDGFMYLLNHTVNGTFSGTPNLQIRSHDDFGLVFSLIIVWIVGMVVQECQQLYTQGPIEYLTDFYNLIDFTMLFLYITAISCYLTGAFKVWQSVAYFKTFSNWEKLRQGDAAAMHHIYWICADRQLWQWNDPYTIFDGLFALANALSFCRVSYLLPASEKIGPLKITLGMIVYDVIRFGLIFIVIFMPFLVSLLNLYWYYNQTILIQTSLDTEQTRLAISDKTIPASEAFAGYSQTFRTLFWSLFGYGDFTNPELGSNFANTYTESIGNILYGSYHIALVIIMMNMLIAMMSKSFEDIAQDEDHEWKFARAALYMDYIRKGCTLAVPFNVIPPPKLFITIPLRLYNWCRNRNSDDGEEEEDETGSKSSTSAANHENPAHKQSNGKSLTQSMELESSIDESKNNNQNTEQYQTVIRKIVDRYVAFTLQEEDVKQGNADDIKQDLSSFRFQMLNQFTEQTQIVRLLQENVVYLKNALKESDDKYVGMQQTLEEIHETCKQNMVPAKPDTKEIGIQAPSWDRNPLKPEKTKM